MLRGNGSHKTGQNNPILRVYWTHEVRSRTRDKYKQVYMVDITNNALFCRMVGQRDKAMNCVSLFHSDNVEFIMLASLSSQST